MAQPVWITDSGSIGTIPEKVFYQLSLLAYDPADPLADNVFFKLIAGALPNGLQISDNGLVAGVPTAIASFQGVPAEVGADITSKFTVRAYTVKLVGGVEVVDRFRDRTFEITVTGENVPKFITPAGQILQAYDGTPIKYQIEFTDSDPSDQIVVKLAGGSLPPGTTINTHGLISGLITPLQPVAATPGYSNTKQGFDGYPFDFPKNVASTNFEFTVEITDGKTSNLRNFSIYVYARESFTADTSYITADNTFVTADISPAQIPWQMRSGRGAGGKSSRSHCCRNL